MKKLGFLAFVIAMGLISSVVLSSCQKQNTKGVSSDIVSSEMTSAETSTSEPEKEAETSSPKSESSEESKASSKPKPVSSKNSVSSDFLSNITITPPFPRPQKEQTVSSEPEDDDSDFDSYFSTESYPETELDKHKRLIRGEWDFDLDLTPYLIASGYDVKEPIILPHQYVFSDRSYTITVSNRQEFNDKVGPYIIPKIEKQLKNELKREGITEAEFKMVMGMSVSDYAKKIFRTQVHTPVSRSGGYFFKDGKLYLGDLAGSTTEECIYAFIDDNTLVITYDDGSVTVRRHIEQDTTASE